MSAHGRYRRLGQAFLILCLSILLSLIPLGMAFTLKLPEAGGGKTIEESGAVADISNTDQGYFMIKRQSSKRQVLQVKKGSTTYQYDINGDNQFEVIPLQMGSGTYAAQLLEQVSGTKYSKKLSKNIKATLVSDDVVFEYPNQYVNYNADTKAVAIANDICAGLTTNMDKFQAVKKYVEANMVYDYMFASQVTSKSVTVYVPNIDQVLDKKMGICFDFAAVVACMLRSQDVPTKLVVGYADKTYHAWNNVYVDDKWGLYDATFNVTGGKASKYTQSYVY